MKIPVWGSPGAYEQGLKCPESLECISRLQSLPSQAQGPHNWVFLGVCDCIFKFGIPWGFGDSMIWESWELETWDLLGVIGLGGTRGLGTCILWGVGSPESQNGVSKFWGPPKGEVIT